MDNFDYFRTEFLDIVKDTDYSWNLYFSSDHCIIAALNSPEKSGRWKITKPESIGTLNAVLSKIADFVDEV